MVFVSLIWFPQLFHPVAILIMLIYSTLILIIIIILIIKTSWLRYILFLIILGGLLVLFIYIISLTPNNKIIKISFLSFGLSLFLLFTYPPQQMKDYKTFSQVEEVLYISKRYFPFLIYIIILISLFLLLALLIIVYISQFNKTPLRVSFYGSASSKISYFNKNN